ncbi:hypothetical protein MFIFM68171_05704 [Madurella fahalii]|uniref:Uncharacterized protein n=1 Tax=Madurella fahalii TaxID=1157608 RepID=A0ABQ0GCS8_9PEZI
MGPLHVTFVLCVWTAVHPNIAIVPPRRESLALAYYRLSWMIAAALIPEGLVCTAVAQLKQARAMHGEWENYWPRNSAERRWLGMSGAFFVVMGGYVLKGDGPDSGSSPLEDASGKTAHHYGGRARTITAAGFRELLRHETPRDLIKEGRLDQAHFDRRNIEGKSKADALTKVIVTLQILWMVGQWVGRKVAGLPITLLEVHVLIQIPFSLIAYLCWLHKPLNVAMSITSPLSEAGLSELSRNEDAGNDEALPCTTPALVKEWIVDSKFVYMLLHVEYDITSCLDSVEAEIWMALMAVANGGLHCAAWAYISVRSLPDGAYSTVVWSDHVQHI